MLHSRITKFSYFPTLSNFIDTNGTYVYYTSVSVAKKLRRGLLRYSVLNRTSHPMRPTMFMTEQTPIQELVAT